MLELTKDVDHHSVITLDYDKGASNQLPCLQYSRTTWTHISGVNSKVHLDQLSRVVCCFCVRFLE